MRDGLGTFLQSNRKFWDTVTPLHIQSDYYRVKRERVLQRQLAIDKIAMQQLGDVRGKTVIQPLCHLGYEALSLAMLGASSVVGWDFNECAVAHANEIAREMGLTQCRFMASELDDIQRKIRRPFDVMFVSYGSLCWIPCLQDWLASLAPLMARGAELIIVDFHPMLFCFDFLQSPQVVHSCFHDITEPIRISRLGSYAIPDHEEKTISFNWNHAVSTLEIGLRVSGFKIISFEEYPYLPEPNGFPNLSLGQDGFFRPSCQFPHIPLMLSFKAEYVGSPV